MAWTSADISFKTLLNKRQSDSTKLFYEEFGDFTINTHVDELWATSIPATCTSTTCPPFIKYYDAHTLKVDPTVLNQLTWAAVTSSSSTFNFGLSDDPTNPRLKDWISDKYGADYDLKLYMNGVQEPKTSVDHPWRFNYATGEMTFNSSSGHPPLQIRGFRYIGPKGTGGYSISYIDGSLAARDVSINWLNINKVNNASLNLYELKVDIDASLALYALSSYVDASLGTVRAQYIPDVSLNQSKFKWVGGYLEPSAASGVSQTYIDGSLAARDASMNFLNQQRIVMDISIGWLTFRLSTADTSISSLTVRVNNLEASIGNFTTKVYVDGSLASRDASITWLFNNKISGGSNVGSGDVSIYYGSVTGNLQFRTIKGSGAAVVTRTDDTITISLDASFAGEVNTASNMGGGYGLYKQKVGSDLQFLSIKSSTNSISFRTDASQLYIDALYDTSLNGSLSMPSAVGGIPAGTLVSSLKSDTLISLFDELLFPTVQPTISAPYVSFNVVNSSLLLEPSIIMAPLIFTVDFSRGYILNNTTFQNYRSGLPNSYRFSGTGLSNVSTNSLTYNPSTASYTVKYGSSINTWVCTASYNVGAQPLDNKGNNAVVGPLAAGDVSSFVTIEGAYPIFATTVNNYTLDKQPLVSMSDVIVPVNGMTLAAESSTGSNKQAFEISSYKLSLNSLNGVQTYNVFTGQWEYELGSAVKSLTRWTTASSSEYIQGFVTNYTKYTYNGPDRSSVKIRLMF